MLTEVLWNLLRPDGRLGVILPSGVYSDFGTRDLRSELLLRGRLDVLYAFQNEKRVFEAAHHAFRQVVVLAQRAGTLKSSGLGFACVWATPHKLTRFPMTFFGMTVP
jgi:hypothetical protein